VADKDDLLARIKALESHLALIEAHFASAFWQGLDLAYDVSLPHRAIRCIVCEHTAGRGGFDILTDRCMFGGGKLERYRCPSCDCIFGPQKYLDVDDDFVSRDYKLLYARYSETDSTHNEIRTFRSLAPKLDGVYLDWGCGGAWSKTVDTLRGEGFSVYGYDPSATEATEFIINSIGLISARFDGIFSNNVIEHFRDPVSQFNYFHQILKDGAIMAHSSPCYDYSYTFSRFHTLFLLGRSPSILAERTGFKIINIVRDSEYTNYVFARM
jgi:hypothetical protein